MPSIRKIKQRQVYHHRSFKEVEYIYSPEHDYLTTLFPGVEAAPNPCVGSFQNVVTLDLSTVFVMNEVPRLSETHAFRTKGKMSKSIAACARAANLAMMCQRVNMSSKFIEAILETVIEDGEYCVTDPVQVRYLERDGADREKIGVTHDIRVRDKVYRHNGVKYHVAENSVTFYFEHKKD